MKEPLAQDSVAGSPYGKALVIGIKREAGRITGKDGRTLNDLLDSSGIEFELVLCKTYPEAYEMARSAAGETRYFIAAGDDRLIHEVVNAMLGEEPAPHPESVLAVIPGPRRSDFTRTFGLPADPAEAVSHLGGEPYFAVDAGKVFFEANGRTEVRSFCNLAEVGIGAAIVRRAAVFPRALGRVGRLFGFWTALAGYRNSGTAISLDARELDVHLCNLIVANGQFFREGMRLAPKAHPSDGRFDVLVMKGTKSDYVASLTKARRGDHVPDPSIREYMSARVEVRGGSPLEVHADGKFLGRTPATFEIVPNAFKLKI